MSPSARLQRTDGGSLGPVERAALTAFINWVRSRFGSRVCDLQLFGSRARGDETAESDVDVLVLIDDLTSSERREVEQLSGDAMTGWNVLLCPLVMSSAYFADLRARERRIAREIERDGIPL